MDIAAAQQKGRRYVCGSDAMTVKALVGKGTVCAGLLLLCQGVAASTTVYKSVDDDGGVVFTDRPPENGVYEEVEGFANDPVDNGPTDNEFRVNDEQQSFGDPVTKNARESQQSEEPPAQPEQQTAMAETRASNCKAARDRLERYTGAGRLYRADENGEREYLSSKEIDEERVNAARLVEEWCS
jgi:hypothetical protein